MYPFFTTARSSKTSFPLLAEAEERFSDDKRTTPLEAILAFLFKRSAKHLKTHLAARHGLALSHGQALDAVSASVGCPDWNTVNALLQSPRETPTPAPSESLPMPSALVTPLVLSDALDFSESSLVVGPAGCGKTWGLLFALQNKRALHQHRPVLVIRTPESPRFQPNWGGALGHLPNVRTLATLNAAAAVSAQDLLDYCPDDSAAGTGPGREASQLAAVSVLTDWLLQRAHLKPLVLVEEAYSALGEHALSFLKAVPPEATVVWTTQALHDLADIPLVRSRFAKLYLMKGAARHVEQLEEAVGAVKAGEILPALRRLAQGEAIVVGFNEARTPSELRAALLPAFMTALRALPLESAALPKNVAPAVWLNGTRLYVQEIKLREQLVSCLAPEVHRALGQGRSPTTGLASVTTAVLEMLDAAGILVRRSGDVEVPAQEALWNIAVGCLSHKGILILELPADVAKLLARTGESRVVPVVTCALFDATQPSRRLGNLLRSPAPGQSA